MTPKPIAHDVLVAAPPERAFELFAARLGEWWPLAYTFGEADCEDALIEPRAGGRWFERTRDGKELSWGEVRAYEPGRRLVLEFAIGADRKPAPPGASSELEIRFVPEGEQQTRVQLEHRAFERHDQGAETLRAGMNGPQGWPLILAEFRRAVRRASR